MYLQKPYVQYIHHYIFQFIIILSIFFLLYVYDFDSFIQTSTHFILYIF